jgi:signal transduction histidine kinase
MSPRPFSSPKLTAPLTQETLFQAAGWVLESSNTEAVYLYQEQPGGVWLLLAHATRTFRASVPAPPTQLLSADRSALPPEAPSRQYHFHRVGSRGLVITCSEAEDAERSSWLGATRDALTTILEKELAQIGMTAGDVVATALAADLIALAASNGTPPSTVLGRLASAVGATSATLWMPDSDGALSPAYRWAPRESRASAVQPPSSVSSWTWNDTITLGRVGDEGIVTLEQVMMAPHAHLAETLLTGAALVCSLARRELWEVPLVSLADQWAATEPQALGGEIELSLSDVWPGQTGLFLWDDSNDRLVASTDDQWAFAVRRPTSQAQHPLIEVVLQRQGLLWSALPQRAVGLTNAVSMVAAPILWQGQVLGVLARWAPAADAFTEEDLRRLTLATQLVAASLQTARRLQDSLARDKMRSQMFTTISHELRTFLNNIGGFAEMLLLELDGPLTPGQHESVERIMLAHGRLLRLVSNVLDLARLNVGTHPFFPDWVEVSEILQHLSRQAEDEISARRKPIQVSVEYPAQAVRLWADPQWLETALGQLVSNAVKIQAQGKIFLRAWTAMDDLRGEICVFIEVEDQGPGISPAEIDLIFEEYFQGHDPLTQQVHAGTGIGLAIARAQIHRHGGTISVRSQVGLGSIFTVCLPLSQT